MTFGTAREEGALKNLALINAQVVDGTDRPTMAPATILMEGAVLAAVGPTTDISLPEDCCVIDLQGRTIFGSGG